MHNIRFKSAVGYLVVATLMLCIQTMPLYGFGMGGKNRSQDANKDQQSRKAAPVVTQDTLDKDLESLQKILNLDEVQKIKFDKYASVLKSDFYALNDSQLNYDDFLVNGRFNKEAFLLTAQKKTKLLPEIQSEFIGNLFGILTNDQKERLKGVRLLLLWQK